jgi:hypothetical protein
MHTCKLLVNDLGADFHWRNSYGCNAIQWAAQTDNVEMCRWLRDMGMSANTVWLGDNGLRIAWRAMN